MDKEIRTLLVPVDFQEAADKALNFAYSVAQLNGDEIALLYVVETPGWFSEFFSSGAELVKVVDDAKEKLQQLVQHYRSIYPEVKASSKVVKGKPYEEILKASKAMEVEYIVLGENHQGESKQKELGTTAYHVTLKASVPVFIYKGESTKFGRKLMVPVDLTKESKKKLDGALEYAIKYGAEVYLVSALVGGIKMRHSRIFRKLKKACKLFSESGVKCHMQIFPRSEKPPYELVLAYSEEIQADLIFIMTHQENSSYDNYIGAFAHHIINEANVPVLSFTASASDGKFSSMMRAMVDPAGIFKKDLLDSD